MALKKQKGSEIEGEEQWLSVDASMTGKLTFNEAVNLRINGRFEGELDTKGNLSIGRKAFVKATIRGESIRIDGVVQGNILASGLVELQSGARVTGDIAAARIVMQDGAFMDGTLKMGKHPERNWMNPEELARYLEVDVNSIVQWAEEGRLPASNKDGGWQFDRTKIEEWLAEAKINQG